MKELVNLFIVNEAPIHFLKCRKQYTSYHNTELTNEMVTHSLLDTTGDIPPNTGMQTRLALHSGERTTNLQEQASWAMYSCIVVKNTTIIPWVSFYSTSVLFAQLKISTDDNCKLRIMREDDTRHAVTTFV
jgi:hypothetical protein